MARIPRPSVRRREWPSASRPRNPYENCPEEVLRSRYRSGDATALDELLWQDRERFVRQATIWSGGDPEICEEALSEFSASLLEPNTRERFDPARPWQPWASTVLLNCIRDLLRRRTRCVQRDGQQEPGRGIDSFSGGTGDPFEEAVHREEQELWDACRACLPDDDRRLLHLRYNEELTLKEIAKLLGLSKPTVHRRISNALERLRPILMTRGLIGDGR